MDNRFAVAVATCLLTSVVAIAQSPSVLDLQKDYHVGMFGPTVDVPSGAISGASANGSLSLTSSGQLSILFNQVDLTVSGVTSSPPQMLAGEYTVNSNGEMVWDLDPMNPGTDLITLWTNVDGSVLHSVRQEPGQDAQRLIAIEKGSGMSNASLTGSYYGVDQTLFFNGTVPTMVNTYGTLNFDGLGTVSYTKTILITQPNSSFVQTVSSTFPYSVAADGTLDLDGAIGGVRGDGQMWFAVYGGPNGGGNVQVSMGVKTGTSYDHSALTGRYSLASCSTELGVAPGLPRTTTNYGDVVIATSSPSTGSFDTNGVTVEGDPTGVTANPFSDTGSTSLTANGELTFASTGNNVTVAMSADANYFLGRLDVLDNNLFFGMRQCGASTKYGTSTTGSGGIAPVLGMKGFPVLGNAAFQLNVTDALGGGIGLVAMSAAQLPGVPAFGGLVWIDPLAIGYSPTVVMQGAPGVAGAGYQTTGLAIPSLPALNGYTFYAQAVVLDPGAPAGLAMSNGLKVVVCN